MDYDLNTLPLMKSGSCMVLNILSVIIGTSFLWKLNEFSSLMVNSVWAIPNGLRSEYATVDEVWLMHGPEHIERHYWDFIFMEVKRVLKPNGKFCLGYPEWITI